MNTKDKYFQELKDKLVDLEQAIDNKNNDVVTEVIEEIKYILSDIEESEYK